MTIKTLNEIFSYSNFNHFKFVEKSINIYYIKEVNYEDIYFT